MSRVPRSPLFSTYRTGENRVTSSMMAVFERIDLALVQELLETATGGSGELPAVTFQNQVVIDGAVPDARISARFSWWFETKTARGAYAAEGHGRSQIRNHAAVLTDAPEARLFVLTPDPARPSWFDVLDGVDEAVCPRVLWLSFQDLAAAIGSVTADPARLLGEQARYLLTELVALFEADGLLSADDTVVVAARAAWPDYQKFGAYVCQPNRAFRKDLTHFGFYEGGAIRPLVPQILKRFPAVALTRDEAERQRQIGEKQLADLIDELLDAEPLRAGDLVGVILLTRPGDPSTVQLAQPIVNDTVTDAGRPWAWTMGQRYTSLSKLTSGAKFTSEL